MLKHVLGAISLLSCLFALTAASSPEPKNSPEELRAEAFIAAQYAMLTNAAAAVDRMTARFAAGSGQLATLEKKRDDLTEALADADRHVASVVASTAPTRESAMVAALQRRQETRAALDQLDEQIAAAFPQYFELTRPRPLSVQQVQRLLHPDEALLLALVLDDATYVWAMSKDAAEWARVDALPAKTLAEKVRLLRASMGVEGSRGSIPEDATRAAQRVQGSGPSRPRTTFQIALAHELYRELLGPVEAVVSGKRVLLTNVSGPLTSLPLSLLVTSPPSPGQDLSQVSWLADRYALAELPSVSSLRALRCLLIARRADAHPGCETTAESSNYRRAKSSGLILVGFGAPVLGGKLPDGSAAPPAPADVMTRAGAVPSKLRALSELPQAKAELDSLARQFGARAAVATGAEATESAVRSSKAMSNVPFVVFSTHGLLATEIGENTEPGLVFTPPPSDSATAADDGLLTASEAAQLRLAADLVVLSACNTAAPSGKPGAEGLSGLARAFFFAGARSMLVSHWAVSDEATSKLMQNTFAELQERDFRGRALALQKAMQQLRIAENGRFADPRYWAPFTLVGEPVS